MHLQINHHTFHIRINTRVTEKLADSIARFFSKMTKTETQENQPPPGYPTATENPPTSPTGKKFRPRTKTKGERGFIEGCLFALCCCWLCEECF